MVKRTRKFPFPPPVFSSTRLKGETSMSMKLMIITAAMSAALAASAFAESHGHQHTRTQALRSLHNSTARASVDNGFEADARGPYNRPPAFTAYPTDYLMNRFADQQLQGR
jgi:hypothetical protein